MLKSVRKIVGYRKKVLIIDGQTGKVDSDDDVDDNINDNDDDSHDGTNSRNR